MTFIHNLAEGCMPFLYFLQSIRNPILDGFFALITHLGEETFFLAIAIFFFWCVNKREGYFILITGLVGTIANQLAKLFFRVPRPWVLDSKFKEVASARAEATGYSFPSGHTQNIAGTYGAIAAHKPKRWKTALCTTIIVLVAFSRMYLGVHTPLDVAVSLLFALGLILLLRPVFESEESMNKFMPWVIVSSIVLSVGFLAYVLMISGDKGLDPDNYASASESAYTLLGCTAGLLPIYIIDKKYIKFETKARWYAQIIKLAVGLGGVLAIKSGLSKPLIALFGNEYIARSVRYFLMVMFAGAVWPLTFKWFSNLEIGFMERFSDRAKAMFAKKK